MASSVWSATDAATNGMTLSNGGLTVTPSSASTYQTIRGSISKTAGKLYIEFKNTVVNTDYPLFGAGSTGINIATYLGNSNYSIGMFQGSTLASSGFTSNYSVGAFAPANNGVVGLAVDFDTGKVWLALNNVWINSSNPATGTLPVASFVLATVGALFPAITLGSPGAGVWTLQADAASQKYAPPSGFSAWDPPQTSVWSAADATANGMTLSNGGLTVNNATELSGSRSIRSTTSHASGKFYIEFLGNSVVAQYAVWGLGSSGFDPTVLLGNGPYSCGIYNLNSNFVSAGFTSNYVVPLSIAPSGDVYALAVDFSGSVWLAQNNVWVNGSNPATGSLPILSFTPATVGALFAGISLNSSASLATWTLQATAASQKYTPPSGFAVWDAVVAPVITSRAAALMIGA